MKGRSTCLWWYEGLDILVIMIHQTRRCMWYTVGYYFVSTLYQEQHAPKNSQIPQTLKRCLCSRILDISKAYRLNVDIRTFAPNMSLCTDKYVDELHEKMIENAQEVVRRIQKCTEPQVFPRCADVFTPSCKFMPHSHSLAEADSLSQEDFITRGHARSPRCFASVEAIDFDLYESILLIRCAGRFFTKRWFDMFL